jgi:DNA-binding NarL/FixJ family response regulator
MPDTPQPTPKDTAGDPGSVVEFPGTPVFGRPRYNNLPLQLTDLVAVPEQQPSPANGPTERLTSREREVALLLARGLNNRRIALELSISEHTVANHVRKILKKLGLRSRTQISSSS